MKFLIVFVVAIAIATAMPQAGDAIGRKLFKLIIFELFEYVVRKL